MKRIIVILLISFLFLGCTFKETKDRIIPDEVYEFLPPDSDTSSLKRTNKYYWYKFIRNNHQYLLYYVNMGHSQIMEDRSEDDLTDYEIEQVFNTIITLPDNTVIKFAPISACHESNGHNYAKGKYIIKDIIEYKEVPLREGNTLSSHEAETKFINEVVREKHGYTYSLPDGWKK